ncbi:flavodoxin family protein [Spirochaeta isovalerica]|uniref:Menaquinone-dependent protoporphyrinogen IX oxidase n=1 Tax=Spirochaeta isovalerica TaxID=150 RepID=A0A841RA61_9SPIO|nr:flavodoxin domain-containing protein [Spirochaeta isovalerica]MBB6480137.1 menaquinone-dependent protoporphyrinogen IX oxidase [Spirochaeta isovalerica]
MKSVVVYYSHTGNNRYLAEKTALALNSEAIEIHPRFSAFPFLVLSSLTKLSSGIRKIDKDFSSYDSVILCGPIWMGQIVSPLNDFLKKYISQINRLHFITCCGSKDSTKEDKFGYSHVFRKLKEMIGKKAGLMEAFPIELILPAEDKENDQAMMEARLSDRSFNEEIKARLEAFAGKLTAS